MVDPCLPLSGGLRSDDFWMGCCHCCDTSATAAPWHGSQPGEEGRQAQYRPNDHRAGSVSKAGTTATAPPPRLPLLPLRCAVCQSCGVGVSASKFPKFPSIAINSYTVNIGYMVISYMVQSVVNFRLIPFVNCHLVKIFWYMDIHWVPATSA